MYKYDVLFKRYFYELTSDAFALLMKFMHLSNVRYNDNAEIRFDDHKFNEYFNCDLTDMSAWYELNTFNLIKIRFCRNDEYFDGNESIIFKLNLLQIRRDEFELNKQKVKSNSGLIIHVKSSEKRRKLISDKNTKKYIEEFLDDYNSHIKKKILRLITGYRLYLKERGKPFSIKDVRELLEPISRYSSRAIAIGCDKYNSNSNIYGLKPLSYIHAIFDNESLKLFKRFK